MLYALTDFGSTFTKVAVVDAAGGRLLGTAQSPTTVDSDVCEGFAIARDAALAVAGLGSVDRTLAASSAAGGLRMMAVGLVDDLTAAAARRSALSAGAKVESVLSGRLGDEAAIAVRDRVPDVILFAGGTDGGERAQVLKNARAISRAHSGAAVVVACNHDVAEEVGAEFARTGHETVLVDNVLPRVDIEHSGPARRAIRELFIRRVIHARGLSETAEFFDAMLMPTPAAVLACAELLAGGSGERPGCASVLLVDVGGATTDVHSVTPDRAAHLRRARAAPAPDRSVRTVEGDLGVRWNADSVYANDQRWIAGRLQLSASEIERAVALRKQRPAYMPEGEADRDVDRALATSCIAVGLERHVGRLATRYIPGEGAEVVLEGRDLRDAPIIFATGGSIVRDGDQAERTVRDALARMDADRPLPADPAVVIDRSYIAAAAGLLATVDPDAAMMMLYDAVPSLCSALPA